MIIVTIYAQLSYVKPGETMNIILICTMLTVNQCHMGYSCIRNRGMVPGNCKYGGIQVRKGWCHNV